MTRHCLQPRLVTIAAKPICNVSSTHKLCSVLLIFLLLCCTTSTGTGTGTRTGTRTRTRTRDWPSNAMTSSEERALAEAECSRIMHREVTTSNGCFVPPSKWGVKLHIRVLEHIVTHILGRKGFPDFRDWPVLYTICSAATSIAASNHITGSTSSISGDFHILVAIARAFQLL